MSIINYGKKLIAENALVCQSQLAVNYDFRKIWTPDFMESIIFISSSKIKYQSVLHFFWISIFHEREIKTTNDALEIFTSTHLHQINLEATHTKIKQRCPQWYIENSNLLPQAKWTHIIWNDENDLLIVFEDENNYYAWSWDSISGGA